MSNSTEREYYKIWFPVATSALFILSGLLVQSFIVTVNVIDWLKGRLMKATDQIITFIGIARIFCLISSLLEMFLRPNCKKYNQIFSVYILCTWQISDFSSIWLSTLLSIFVSFRISTFPNAFFLRLQAIITRRVIYLIIGSVLLGFFCPFLNLIDYFICFRNLDYADLNRIKFSFYLSCYLFPLSVYFASSVLLVVFLGFHVSGLKKRSNIMSNTDTYRRAIHFTMVSFLTSASCITINITEYYEIELFGLLWMYLIWNIFPVFYSICLIYLTAKLRNRLRAIILSLTDCLFKRKASDPKSGKAIETITL